MDLKEKIAILRSAQTQRVDHLPIVSAYCRKLDLIDTLNQIVPTEMGISPGVIFQGMVLDIRDAVDADFFEDFGVIAHTKTAKNRPVGS